MFLPKEVVEEEISRQGIFPMVAPVKPYTLLALICNKHHGISLECPQPLNIRIKSVLLLEATNPGPRGMDEQGRFFEADL